MGVQGGIPAWCPDDFCACGRVGAVVGAEELAEDLFRVWGSGFRV